MSATTDRPSPFQAWRLADYWFTLYRRTWRGSVVTSFVNPLLYVVAMGVLLGGFVHADPQRLEGAHSYLQFVVPGMLAAQSMQVAIGEVTFPVMTMLKWHKTYFSMAATPLRVVDLVVAHLGFAVLRLALTAVVFTLVLAPFGVFHSVLGACGVVLVQLLLGLAFAAPIYAYAAVLRNEMGFTLIFRLLMIPLTLFSGAFFPLSNLPAPLEAIARVSPLWQGVSLTRMFALGTSKPGPVAAHLAYLVVLAAVGVWLSVRALTRRLIF
ncbi:ABC transporter permease [Allobranchiibius sp. GilTou73]|uniref:ABC transporter permease n=1 Tax=Allobranchiibius sp. GilTou73 TaxID=2904523 RepID=UPI001F22A1E4|nr:ABC transporter permease [Allobranchiibius sp. GilTou73]UIJ33571.1 ABC transporter permease [Allobranchiibius sp. GilTou73]